jgi:hypothetical protein
MPVGAKVLLIVIVWSIASICALLALQYIVRRLSKCKYCGSRNLTWSSGEHLGKKTCNECGRTEYVTLC